MKSLTVYQPWASILVFGEKEFESRSWHTNYTGPIAIHAGRTVRPQTMRLCRDEPFRSALARHGIHGWEELPIGVVVGVAEITDCCPTESVTPTKFELALGDWAPGRYAWRLANPYALPLPVPMRGRLSLFDLDPQFLAQVEAQLHV